MGISDLITNYPFSRFAFIETNLFSVVFLAVMLISNMRSDTTQSNDTCDRLFNRLVTGTILVIIFDSCMWIFNAQTFSGARIINTVVSTLCFIFTPIVSYLAIEYIHNKAFLSALDRRKFNLIFHIPVILAIGICLLNLKTGWLFTISEDNMYTRGPLFFFFNAIPFVYLAYTSILTLFIAKSEKYPPSKKSFRKLSAFVIPAFIGGLLQTIFGLSVTWPGVAISIFILYVTVQNSQLMTDPLTGVGNRRSYEIRLSDQINSTDSSGSLFAIMIDVDRFKEINDTYGHHVGDCVLVDIGHILCTACYGEGAFVFRYGGDEFAVLGFNKNAEQGIKRLINKINISISEYNEKIDAHSPAIAISHGHAIYDSSIDKNADVFMSRADKAMYVEKLKKMRL